MAKIGTFNALAGSQFKDCSINNTIVLSTDMEDQPVEDQTPSQTDLTL
jgi:hypothetical protein